jgi:hypothetical protein
MAEQLQAQKVEQRPQPDVGPARARGRFGREMLHPILPRTDIADEVNHYKVHCHIHWGIAGVRVGKRSKSGFKPAKVVRDGSQPIEEV